MYSPKAASSLSESRLVCKGITLTLFLLQCIRQMIGSTLHSFTAYVLAPHMSHLHVRFFIEVRFFANVKYRLGQNSLE